MTTESVINEITAERRRQVDVEGYTTEHDAGYSFGTLALAGASYAQTACHALPAEAPLPMMWPWGAQTWKPKDRRRNLIRAAALIIAEIERLDRAEGRR